MSEGKHVRGGTGGEEEALSLHLNMVSLVRPLRGPDRINHSGFSQVPAGLFL